MKFIPVLSFPVARKLGHSVGEFVKSADLQAETMVWIAHNAPVDAVLGPMDLSIEAEAFGATVRFSEDEVPAVTGQLVADEDDVAALAVPPPSAGRCTMAAEAIAKVKAMGVDKKIYGGMIGPFSLAGRLSDVNEMMFLLMDEPETVHALLEKTTAFLSAYGAALKAAGADGLFMAEPLAGVISTAALEEFSAPYVRRIVEALRERYEGCGGDIRAGLGGMPLWKCHRVGAHARKGAGKDARAGQRGSSVGAGAGKPGRNKGGGGLACRALRGISKLRAVKRLRHAGFHAVGKRRGVFRRCRGCVVAGWPAAMCPDRQFATRGAK